MAWTEPTRRRYAREGDRYASDLTDAEWAGRPRTTDLRDVFDAILYVATTGCQWRLLPEDFPPVFTVLWWANSQITGMLQLLQSRRV